MSLLNNKLVFSRWKLDEQLDCFDVQPPSQRQHIANLARGHTARWPIFPQRPQPKAWMTNITEMFREYKVVGVFFPMKSCFTYENKRANANQQCICPTLPRDVFMNELQSFKLNWGHWPQIRSHLNITLGVLETSTAASRWTEERRAFPHGKIWDACGVLYNSVTGWCQKQMCNQTNCLVV